MSGYGQGVHIPVTKTNRNLPGGLYGVYMDGHAVRVGDADQFLHGFHGADLVVGQHGGDHRGTFTGLAVELAFKCVEIEMCLRIHGMRTTSKPNHSCSHAADWATAGCSIAEMIMRGRQFAGCLPSASANPQTGRKPSLRMRAMAMPLMARLSDSVPPEVKITSSGRAPNAAANDARAASSARAAVLPGWCTLAGLA